MNRRLVRLLAPCLTLTLLISLLMSLPTAPGGAGRAAAAPRSPAAPARAPDPASAQPGQFYSVRGRAAGPLDIAANATATVTVAGVAGVPASGVATVALNLASKGSTAVGSLVVFPSGAVEPEAIASAYRGDRYVHNHVTAKVGTDGRIKITNRGGSTVRVYADLYGYTLSQAGATAGSVYVGLPETEILDSTSVAAGATYTFTPLGLGGIPNSLAVTHIAVTVLGSTSGTGKLTLYPSGTTQPALPNLDLSGNAPAQNFMIIPLGADGKLNISATGAQATVQNALTVLYDGVRAASGYTMAKIGDNGAVEVTNHGDATIRVQVDVFAYYAGPVAPGAPGGVTGTPRHQGVQLTWQPPANDGGTPVTGYQVTASPGGATASTSGETTATVRGLENGRAYTFTVTATNLAGTGPPSPPSAAITPVAGRVPGPPTAVTGTPGHGQIKVSWKPPADDGHDTITRYTVTASPGGETVSTSWGWPGTEATVTGLLNGTPYTFTVTATNSIGTGAASAPSCLIAPEAWRPPGKPLITEVFPRDQAVRVSWSPPETGGSDLTGYQISANPGGRTIAVEPDETEATVTGLTNGESYTFSVVAINDVGRTTSRASDPVIPVAAEVPLRPLGLMATPLNGRIDVQWVEPPDGGAPVTGYRLTAEPGGHAVDVPADTTVAAVTGLTNGTDYLVKVVATNKADDSQPSEQADVTPSPARPPAAPQEIQAGVTATGSVALNWSAPTDTGTAPISGYTVTAAPGSASVTTTGTTVTMTGLDPASQYSFTVRATNTHGTGPPSAATDPLTPKLTVTANPLVVLSEESVDTLRAAHKDGTLYFEDPTPQVTALTAGSIVVITPTPRSRTASSAGSPR